MDRKSFITSIAMLIAAPKVIGELQVLKQEEIKLVTYKKIGYWFKVSTQMEKDTGYIEYLFNDKSSFLWRDCKNRGIDLEQPFDFKIGYTEDDFTRSLRTGVITQRIPI